MDFLGRVKRTVPYKNRNVRDSTVEAWMKSDSVVFQEEYVMCSPNSAAMTKSIAKYNRAQPSNLNVAAWKIAGEWTEKHFIRMSGSCIHPLIRVMKEADRVTSAGYPWSLKYANKGLFMDSPDFLPVMEDFWSKLATDDEKVPIWTASLKLELRPIAKIETNSQRTFTAAPTEHSIACNRLFLDQNELFYQSHNTTWSFVGCSKFNRGFDRLFKRLSKHPNAFELDETAFDASLFREALEGQREIRWNLLRPIDRTPENRKRVDNIYKAIIHSMIVLDNGEVVQKHTGNPSGSANTIVDNTMILYRLFAYAWLCLSADRMKEGDGYRGQGQFETHVEAALNGDDNTFTCSDAVVAWFNPTSISKVWTAIGVVTKTPCEKPRRLEQVSFLSQEFVKIEGTWLPKPERSKVLCSLLNASEFDDPRWTLMRVSALRLESWADVQLRKELVQLQQYIWKHFASSHFTRGKVDAEINGLLVKDIVALWKTDEEIRRLYMCPKLEAGFEDMAKMESIVTLGGLNTPFKCLSQSKVAKARVLRLRKCAVCKCETVSYETQEHYCCKDCRPKPHLFQTNGGNITPISHSVSISGETEMYIPNKMPKGKRKGPAAPHKKGGQPKRKKAKKNGKKRKGAFSGGDEKRYTAPVQMGSVRTTVGAKSRPFTVTHRESLGVVNSPGTAFTVANTVAINPGLPASFPWLSNIAQQYETYKFRKIRFCYETRSSTANSGVVIMVTNYDASEGAFTSTQQAENYRGARVGQPWISFCHELTKASMNDYNRHYCRAGAPVAGTDIKTYDVGNFSLILSGISLASASLLGELYVEYTVDLFDPRVSNPVGQFLPAAHIVSGPGAAVAGALLTGASVRPGSTFVPVLLNNTQFNMNKMGQFLVVANVFDAAITTAATLAFGTGTSVVNIINNSTANSASGAAAANGMSMYVVNVTSVPTLWAIGGGASTAAGNTDIFIVQTSSGLLMPTVDEKQKESDLKFDALMKVLIAKKIVDDPMSALGMMGAGAA